MKKSSSVFVEFFKKITGGYSHTALMQWSLMLILIALPSVVLPTFGDMFSPIKQAVLVVLSTLAFFGWTLGVYRDQAWQRRKGILVWFPLFILVGVVVSAVGSSSGYSSWIGAGGQGFTAVVPFMALTLLYLMVMHLSGNAKALRLITASAMVGVVLAQIYSVSEMFGLQSLSGENGFPGFSLVGSFESLSILGAIMLLFFVGIWITADKSKMDTWMPNKKWTIVFVALGSAITLLTVASMLVGSKWPTAVVLLIGTGTMIALGLHDPKKFSSPRRMIVPMLLFAVALMHFFFGAPFTGVVPTEIAPNYSSSWQIGVETMRADGLFGSGPGTWLYDFTRFKPEVFNVGQFWQSSFDHANAHVLTLFSTWGVVPTALLLGFFLLIIGQTMHILLMRKSREDWQTVAVLFAVWLAFVSSRFVYSSNVVMDTYFWIFTGIFVSHIVPTLKPIEFQSNGRASLVTSFGIVVSGILFITSTIVSVQWLTGEALIAQAARMQRSWGSSADLVSVVQKAVVLNPWNAGYARALSIAHFKNADSLALDASKNATAIASEAGFAVAEAKRAIALDPLDVRSYAILGTIYENLSSVVSGSDLYAVEEFRKAVALDPNNPLVHVKLARSLVTVSDSVRAKLKEGTARDNGVDVLLKEAEDAVDRAGVLRPDYAPTFYTRALILERQGRLQEAVDQLVPLIKSTPNDPTLRFELGVLLLRAGDKEAALLSLQSAVALAPTYANAKWYLVALYEEVGELDLAIRELEDLNTLNPDDQIVLDKLRLLKQGKASLNAVEEVVPLEEATVEQL